MKHTGEFCKIIGMNTENVILEVLIECRGLDFAISDTAKEAQVSRATAYNVMETLLDQHLIKPTRVISKTQLYTVNEDNHRIKMLIRFFDIVIQDILTKENEKLIKSKRPTLHKV